jgi:hypothetical protein
VDYPKSVPSVGLVDGKFVDENQASGTPGSLIPAQWGNAVTQEILNVIAGGGLPPDEQSNTQLLAAIKKVILQGGVSPGRLLATRLFEANGIYTPTPGTAFVIVEGIGGGGAGGGGPVTSSGNVGGGAGGNGGAYGKALFSIAQIGASQAVTIGAGGIGTTGGGGNGGSTSLGSLLSLPGGAGAFSFGNAGPPLNSGNGGALAVPTGANLVSGVGPISIAASISSVSIGLSGQGANTLYGSGGGATNITGPGISASGFGAGGGGALAMSGNATGRVGGNGYKGFLLISEYA